MMTATDIVSSANGHGLDSRPLLTKKNTGPSNMLHPLDDWHAPAPPGMTQAGRDRRRRELLAALESKTTLPLTESKGGNAMQQRQAIIMTIWSFVATAAFAFFFVLPYRGHKATLDFVTGFLVEKSLSVDNLFVFLMLFEYFKVPEQYTERVLRWGIMSALVLRGVMIAVGVAAVQRFRPVLLAFALILVVSAWKMISEGDEDEDLKDNMVRTPWRNAHRCATAVLNATDRCVYFVLARQVMKIARKLVSATDEYDGDKFFTKVDGVRRATPMLVVLICIELSDVLFAVDSIPAVVGITQVRSLAHIMHGSQHTVLCRCDRCTFVHCDVYRIRSSSTRRISSR